MSDLQSSVLFMPMFAQVILVHLIMLAMFVARVSGVKSGQVRYRYFRVMQAQAGMELPEAMQRTARSFINQFEIPVLFFAVCLLIMNFGVVDSVFLSLAWGFVASRWLHAAIHVFYNNVTHRMLAYTAGVGIQLAMWIRLAVMI